ncbi:MAG: ferrochelatase [Myxococcales bacterium]|nr:ferrochelatase [Myxococcales bacterium]
MSPLAALDAELAAKDPCRRSLAPDRPRAHDLGEILGPALADAPTGLADVFVEGTCAFVRALADAFPENLLWDLDLPLSTWWRAAKAADDPVAAARELLGIATELQGLFGRATALHFRYAHDFLYGYDWAKWVGRDPQARAAVGPFDAAFLRAMRARGHELLALIAAGGDAKYPALPEAVVRNPFAFSREPEAELAIHRALAAVGRIPVPAWRTEATVSWTPPWATWREQVAARLGYRLIDPGRDDADARGA